MKRALQCIAVLLVLSAIPAIISCGGDSSSDSGDSGSMMWTWMSGSDTRNQPGVYPFLFSTPGSRYNSVSWTDSVSDLWLFGGLGYDRSEGFGFLNDLWRFDW